MTQDISHAERLSNLALLEEKTRNRASRDRPFKRAVNTLPEDLAKITAALDTKPESWRFHRAFHIVHVPSLIAVLTLLDDVDQMSDVSDQDRHDVLSSVHRAATLAQDVRHAIEAATLEEAKLELRVLESYAKPPPEPFTKPSKLTRAFDTISSSSESVWTSTKSGALGAVNALQTGLSQTTARMGALPMFASTLQRSMTGMVSDTFITPISMRLQAGTRAIESGVGTGVGLGVIAGVLFPPLLPLTAGGAVLATMKTWRKEMAAAEQLNAAEREVRIAELRAERAAALAQLTKGTGALQMESEDLSMTLDADTGEADAVILTGAKAGSLWSSLSPAEKAEASLAFAEGAASILQILAAAVIDR